MRITLDFISRNFMTSAQTRVRPLAWIIWILASIFYAYQYILRVMPNVLLEDIMLQFRIDAATFGQFSGVYYIGYSLMHLPIGILLDRFGPKNVMTGCILLTVLGLTPLIFAEHWAFPIAGRFVIGMGSSAAILGLFKIIRMSFNEQLFPRMLSISVMIGLLGAIYGGAPVSYLCEVLGYERVVEFFAFGGLALAVTTYWVVPSLQSAAQTTVRADILEVISNRKVVLTCFFAGCMVGPLEGFADVWGTAFLKQVYGFEGTLAASLPSMIFIGMCFGSPLLSFIADRWGSYQGTIVGAGSIMAISFALLLAFPLSAMAISGNFLIVGACCAYQILAIYKASTYVREQVAGLTTAIANMIIMIFGYAFHSIIGAVVNAAGGAANSEALNYGIAVIPLFLAIGTVGFAYLAIAQKKREGFAT